jgi:hypothetical protein
MSGWRRLDSVTQCMSAYALRLSCPDGVSLESNRDLNECVSEGTLLAWQLIVPLAKLLPPAGEKMPVTGTKMAAAFHDFT